MIVGRENVDVYTNDLNPSKIHGASYLHRAPKDIDCGNPIAIHYKRWGTVEGYAQKIYGKGFDPNLTSWNRFHDVESGYSLRDIYAKLHRNWLMRMRLGEVTEIELFGLCREYRLVVFTAPLAALLGHWHTLHFESTAVYIVAGPPVQEVEVTLQEDTIIYNGTEDEDWYRWSKLYGIETCEYVCPVPGVSREVRKPTAIVGDLPSMPPNLLLAGRFGKWDKTQLSDDAYFDTRAALL